MRTFTLEGTTVVPGIKAKQWSADRWVVDGISLNRDCMPEIQDGRVVRASFSKPHYPEARRPHNVDSATWHAWLRETPSIGRSHNPEYTLRAEKSPHDTAVLVRIDGGFYMEPDEVNGSYPAAHRCMNTFTQKVEVTFVRMTPGTRVMLGDGRQCLVYKHGATIPEYYTWRQWELERAEELANPTTVRCVTFKQSWERGQGLLQQCQPGIAVTPDTPLGSAMVIGDSTASPELLPLFEGRCAKVVHSATIGTVAERMVHESDHYVDPKSRSIPLYGFTPAAEADGSTVMVLVEGVAFCNSRVLRGTPTTIMHHNDERYYESHEMVMGACAFLMKEGEAISYRTRKDLLGGDPEYVLDIRDGQLRITAYKEWRMADMNERPEEYLAKKQATPQNIPSSWVGCQVSLGGETYGELLCVDGDAVVIKTDWSHSYGNLPKVMRRTPSWVTFTGDRFESRPASYKKETFLRWKIQHAVFTDGTTSTSLTTGFYYCVRSVVIVDLGMSKTGEVTCMYGAPLLKEGWIHDPWRSIQTQWCDTYQEAERLRATFMGQCGNSTETIEVLKRRLELEQERPDRFMR